MKLIRLLLASLPAAFLLTPAVANAGTPTLQVAPLQYEDTLSGAVKNGHIDVANPLDAPVTVEASVRRFQQVGTNGDLAFSDDADLAAAIKLDLTSFQLAPHDAVRVLFSVDPSKLPAGGTYAAIFFRTIPTDNPNSGSSYVSQSANIGTLLILDNGSAVTPSGGVNSLTLPFWQFGSGITGSALVANTSSPHGGVAFRPELTTSVLPWGHASKQSTGLILPGSQRRFAISQAGSYFGLLPVTITDGATHTSRTAWVFACTGWSAWVVLVLLLTALILLALKATKRRFRLRLHIPERVPVLEPLAEAIAGDLETDPVPDSDPKSTVKKPVEPLPAANPKVTRLIVQAEAAAPDPGTVILPEPEPEPTKPVHKVSVKPSHHPKEVRAKPNTAEKPAKPKTSHKIKVQTRAEPKSRKRRSQ